MRESVREDLLSVLKNVLSALDKMDVAEIEDWSGRTIHSASIFQDRYSTQIAIAIYSLAKILENEKLRRRHARAWERFFFQTRRSISDALICLKKRDIKRYEKQMKELITTIANFDERFREYAEFVLINAKIMKGTKIYEHGISLGRVAELLGISQWELSTLVGKSKVHDRVETITKSVRERLKKTREIL
jgi:hypothetical protein